MEKKLLSIIIPVYNNQDQIKNLIDEILSMELREQLEILCVDDGSEDQSLQVLQSINDKNCLVLTQPHAGVSYARNLALDKATGEYITFFDADDNIDTNKFMAVLNKIKIEKPDLSIFGIYDRFIYSSEKIQLHRNYVENKRYSADEFFQNFGNLLNKHIMYSPCNKIYKRSIIERYQIRFNVECAIGEDMLFNLDYLQHVCNVRMFEEFVYLYNHDMMKISSSSRKYHENEFSILMKIIEKIKLLLENKKVYSKNEKEIHEFLVRKISYSINNLFFKGSHLTKEERLYFIDNLYNNALVKEAIDDPRVKMIEFDQKVLHFLHKRRWKRCILYLYQLKNKR
ncbi:glycosyltransferase family 2 protein [Amedibacillus dolichus]|uniref:glycosyltransferase family 2 protein n=1 Tax=Amedibacillus dolichus TaxID=31971 RepID=UPI00243179A4|nr:glycosyltransferase family 2 protein [Amedibacillus dolichus]